MVFGRIDSSTAPNPLQLVPQLTNVAGPESLVGAFNVPVSVCTSET